MGYRVKKLTEYYAVMNDNLLCCICNFESNAFLIADVLNKDDNMECVECDYSIKVVAEKEFNFVQRHDTDI